MKKKIIISIVVAIALFIAGSVFYVLTNLDSIVKAAIEKYGSEATKTAVHVSSVRIKLSNGEGALRGLTIADPPGFSFPSIMTLDDVSVRIAVKTVTHTPIVIDNVLVSGPEVFYEMKEDGTANIDVLRKNLASGPSREAQPKKASKGKEIRLRIRKFVFEKGKVHVRVAKLGDSTLDLARLELNDIGKQNGATPDEVGRIVATALAEETAKAVAKSGGQRLLQKGAEDLLNKYLNHNK
jgi:uncharacterized protein involved in outer membrane biogenesis